MSQVPIVQAPAPATQAEQLLQNHVRNNMEAIRSKYADEIVNRGPQGKMSWLSWDPGGIFQDRKNTLQHLVDTAEFNGENFGLGLKPWLLGITDADVANGILRKQELARDQQFGSDPDGYGITTNIQTTDNEIIGKIRKEDSLREGAKFLEKHGTSITELNALYPNLKLDPNKRYTKGQLSSPVTQLLKDRRNQALSDEANVDGGAAQQLQQRKTEAGDLKDYRADQTGIAQEANNITRQANQFSQQMALYNAKTNDDWKRFELSMRQADREQTRRDNKQQLLWQMEQRNLDRAYNRERDERADSRAKAQQRLALILKMIGGIG